MIVACSCHSYFPFVIICAKRCSGGFCLIETQERSIATCFDHNAFASFASASCHALVVVVDLTHSVIEALHSNQFKPITSRPSIISLLSLEVACTLLLFVGSVSLHPALAARAPPAVLFAILNLLIDIGCEPLWRRQRRRVSKGHKGEVKWDGLKDGERMVRRWWWMI